MGSSDTLLIQLGGDEVALQVRRSPRARRIALQVEAGRGGVSLVLPRGASIKEGMRFAYEKAVWIQTRLATLPPSVPFVDGAVVPLLGVDHHVRHRPEMRGTVCRAAGEIHVAGQAEHLARRLRDWLRTEAQRELGARARTKASQIRRRVGRVTVREVRSRWGSCSSTGNLSFSWRLILAPEPVLDYVVGHEVAHLAHMNHSPAFWAVVDKITEDASAGRTWLRHHGERLHRYG